ncbi:hypothetical protein NDU88_001851 [Pleurodeles waltl]|uniref:Uncharacterized protein n=1 Tax=Pleurodeles waltl TaxID=8319 RepID=A0AAV7U8T5_PLEWA|nr:hypothetical protein NDU88_001851 [Pleurodeles waltl]
MSIVAGIEMRCKGEEVLLGYDKNKEAKEEGLEEREIVAEYIKKGQKLRVGKGDKHDVIYKEEVGDLRRVERSRSLQVAEADEQLKWMAMRTAELHEERMVHLRSSKDVIVNTSSILGKGI